MKIVRVIPENAVEFTAYCARYGPEHDDSYLPQGRFDPGDDQPAYLLYRGKSILGAACLLRTPPFVQAKKGRYMIFHVIKPEPEAYRLLARTIEEHGRDLESLYLFLPEQKAQTARILETLGYSVQRYAYRLTCRAGLETDSIPSGYTVQTLNREDTGKLTVFWNLSGANMSPMQGHVNHPIDLLLQDLQKPEYLPGGLMMLLQGKQPVGTLHVSRDAEASGAAWIDSISVHPDHRRRGLGRALLHRALTFAQTQGLETINLSVNAENTPAIELYLAEGFKKQDTYICYHKLM